MLSLKGFILGLLSLTVSHGQNVQPNPNQVQSGLVSGNLELYMDRNSDCNTIRQVGDSRVTMYGKGGSSASSTPLSCSITLESQAPIEPKRFKIELLATQIISSGVRFYIYDGEKGQRILDSFDSSRPGQTQPNREYDFLFTTGNRVSFLLTRTSPTDSNYDIRLSVQAVVTTPGAVYDPNNPMYDDYYYNYPRKLDNTIAVGIVSGAFLLIIVIAIIVIVHCHRKRTGQNRPWSKQTFGYVNKGASLNMSNSSAKSTPKVQLWTSENSKYQGKPQNGRAGNSQNGVHGKNSRSGSHHNSRTAPLAPIAPKTRLARPNEDADSVFEHDGAILSKRTEQPLKNYSNRTSTAKYRKAPDTEVDETSFDRANEDPVPKTPVERVMRPRVKTYEDPNGDAGYSSVEPEKRTVAQNTSRPAKKMVTASTEPVTEPDVSEEAKEEEEESEEEESSEEEEEEESSEEDVKAMYAVPDKMKQRPVQNEVPVMINQQQPGRMYAPVGAPMMHAPVAPPIMHAPVQQYVNEPQRIGPGFRPSPQQGYYPSDPRQASGYPPQRPYAQQPRYSQPPQQMAHRQQPQRQHHQPERYDGHKEPARHQLVDSDPPVYSYLVQRGYTPLDAGRHSPVSSSAASNSSDSRFLQHEDSDVSANLESGVELMKR